MIQKDFRILLNVADLNDPDNHDGVVTYLEPDIVECEVDLRKYDYKQS